MKGNRERIWLTPNTRVFCIAIAWAGLLTAAGAATTTWIGNSGDWFDGSKWNNGVPANGVNAVITNGSVLLTNATANLASLTITGETATLTFSNWNTTLTAVNVVIQNGAIVTHVANSATATNADGSWPTYGRVYIVCTNFDLQAGGTIDAEGKGFPGGGPKSGCACGPGAGGVYVDGNWGGGASYGGRSGASRVSVASKGTYGLTNSPVGPGSGGGGGGAGAGGGAVRIDASGGAVTVNGTINANGKNSCGCGGGGSGGAIYITSRTFAGATNGLLSAKGGKGAYQTGTWSGGGGGGRIAVVYDTGAQKGQAHSGVRFNVAAVAGGGPPTNVNVGVSGTIYLPDNLLLTTNWSNFGKAHIYGITNASLDTLSISNNADVVLAEVNFTLTVTNTLLIDAATLKLGSGINQTKYVQLNCGSLCLTNSSCLYVYSGPTNAVTTNFGGRVAVANDIVIASNSWIYPVSNGTNGGSVFFSASNVMIGAGGGFNANGLGYRGGDSTHKGYGPGGGNYTLNDPGGGGGGYGGVGGSGTYGAGGGTYSWTNVPLRPGSGGGGIGATAGGGLVWIKAGTVVLDGAIQANADSAGYYYAAGSGGGIFIVADVFRGAASGQLRACGGRGGYIAGYYGGGGGRIAVWHCISEADQQTILADPDHAAAHVYRFVITNDLAGASFLGACTASNGWDYANKAATGTVVRLTTPPPAEVILKTH